MGQNGPRMHYSGIEGEDGYICPLLLLIRNHISGCLTHPN